MNLNPEFGSPIEKLSAFMLANLLWVVCAVFILPLPAATAGLFAVLAPWVRGNHVELFSTFFGTMRRQWFKSTVIGLLDLIIGGLVLLNLRILDLMGTENLMTLPVSAVTLFFGMALLMVNVYMWPLLVLYDLGLRRLLSVSLRLALLYPVWTMLTIGLALLIPFFGFLLPQFIAMLFIFSGMALAINWGAWRIIRKYATPQELAELEGR